MKTISRLSTSSLCFFVFSFLLHTELNAQRFYSIVFDELPVDMQLYPRNAKNEAVLPITGYIDIPGWKYLSVVVSRNKTFYQYQRSNFSYNQAGNIGTFSLNPAIKSELVSYDIKVYASKEGKDSVLMVERKNIIGGDFYVIYGQSNARGWEERDDYRNEFCRTFGFTQDDKNFIWGLSNSNFTGFSSSPQIVGQWGITIQRYIAEKYNIPTCVINIAPPGTPIKDFSFRDEYSPINSYSHYGQLLTYITGAKLQNHIQGFFYWQGEGEAAFNEWMVWKAGFDKIYRNLQIDLPNIRQLYVMQIPIFPGVEYRDQAGVLRDYQRQLGSFYPKLTSFAAQGAIGWNGFHYGKPGYTQVGYELGRILSHDVYGDPKVIRCPNVQKIYYSSKNRDEITISFEKEQQMIYPKDTLVGDFINGGSGIYRMKDFFYVNNIWKRVATGVADGNRIVVTLKQPASENDSIMNYLPSVYAFSGGYEQDEGGEEGNKTWFYKGPFLKNTDNLRAFAFHNVKIQPFRVSSLAKPVLTAANSTNSQITLKWTSVPNASKYRLERKKPDNPFFEIIFDTNAAIEYTDNNLLESQSYIYRLRARNEDTETEYVILEAKTTALLSNNSSVKEIGMKIFPNPTTETLIVTFEKDLTGALSIYNLMGAKKEDYFLKQQSYIELSVKSWDSGNYILIFDNGIEKITGKITVSK